MPERYQSGFGNFFSTEALSGALPEGRNSPQRAAYGLYAELLSGNAFTAPRGDNRRTWVYRIRPSAAHNAPFRRIDDRLLQSAPIIDVEPSPSQLRWDPFPMPTSATDFIAGLTTLGANGDHALQIGCAVHMYAANRSMENVCFYDADGELLLVPQQGALEVTTELGRLDAAPGEVLVIPRGLRFRVALKESTARGYVCENYGSMFRLPELGPLGSNGLANPRDFWAPVAAFEDDSSPCRLIAKFGGHLWEAQTRGSPFDVVAWHGNLAPYKYALANFMVVGSISFDHPDPSIYTVLTSPSDVPGTANVDFVIFPPRWLVAENTFRPPWFHRNVMSEFMGLIEGTYDSKAEGFLPGGASLHNSWSAHGPDADTFDKASRAPLEPHKIIQTMAFMFESRFVIRPTAAALDAPNLQPGYTDCWRELGRRFDPSASAR